MPCQCINEKSGTEQRLTLVSVKTGLDLTFCRWNSCECYSYQPWKISCITVPGTLKWNYF